MKVVYIFSNPLRSNKLSRKIALGLSGFFTVNRNCCKVSSSVEGFPLSVNSVHSKPNPCSSYTNNGRSTGDPKLIGFSNSLSPLVLYMPIRTFTIFCSREAIFFSILALILSESFSPRAALYSSLSLSISSCTLPIYFSTLCSTKYL